MDSEQGEDETVEESAGEADDEEGEEETELERGPETKENIAAEIARVTRNAGTNAEGEVANGE